MLGESGQGHACKVPLSPVPHMLTDPCSETGFEGWECHLCRNPQFLTPGQARKWVLSERLLNEYKTFYLHMRFSLNGQQVTLRLLSFIRRAMSVFLTRDCCDPVCGLKTRDEDCWST